MRRAVLVLWLATIGADRIDLLGGAGPFMLSPFLLLSPLLVFTGVVTALRTRGSVRLPDGAMAYLLCATLFLCTVVLSVLFSSDVVLSGSRGALLLVEVYATLLAVVLLAEDRDPRRVLMAGLYGGLVVALAFSIVELVYWVRDAASPMPGSIVDFTPATYGPFAPRLSGPSIDPNRGAMLSLVCGYLLFELGRPSRLRTAFLVIAGVLVVGSLSRSVLLAALVCGVAAFVRRGGLALRPSRVLAFLVAAAVGMAAFLAVPSLREIPARFNAPLLGRLALRDASSSTHVELIARGWEVTQASVSNALVGVGFGNASSVLQDIIPGDRHANFHSLYITLLAESGVFALVLGIVLLVAPLWRSPRLAPLFLGLMIINVSYQTSLEPLFWFVVALAWLKGVGEGDESVPATESRVPGAPVLAARWSNPLLRPGRGLATGGR